jgi:hypothetical protein
MLINSIVNFRKINKIKHLKIYHFIKRTIMSDKNPSSERLIKLRFAEPESLEE